MTSFELTKINIKKITPDGKSHWVLENINLGFESNHRIGLLGKNGSGKTTLVRIISRLDKVSKGRLSIHPKETRVTIMLQRPEEHFLRATVGEQINSYAPKSLSHDAIYKLMDQVGLATEIAKLPPIRLSTGQQRLVAIACVIATESLFLIFDEPMAGLDANGRRLIKQALTNIHSEHNKGWIIVSHHPDDLLGLVDRLWIMDQGKLINDSPFHHPDLTKLKACMSTNDISLYYLLTRLEAKGINIPDEIYNKPTRENLISALNGVKYC